MSIEIIYIAGRYNKYMRNVSGSPWIDKDDKRVTDSVEEMLEDGFAKYLKYSKSVFTSSGREDIDVRMLGKGRPFTFKLFNPIDADSYNENSFKQIQKYINTKYMGIIRVRDLQTVSNEEVKKNFIMELENKTKEYRALCCCSRKLTETDVDKLNQLHDLCIDQKTPIRVLHRRTLATRRRRILKVSYEQMIREDRTQSSVIDPEEHERVFALRLITEAGTYIKEFVHGDFGRTQPNLSSLLGDCDTDLVELDVLEVNSEWPPTIEITNDE